MPGIMLEDHPRRLVRPLLAGAVRGSDGIPDSLVHKPVDTSGAGCGQHVRPSQFDHLLVSTRPFRCSRLSFIYICFSLLFVLFRAILMMVADSLTCGNRR